MQQQPPQRQPHHPLRLPDRQRQGRGQRHQGAGRGPRPAGDPHLHGGLQTQAAQERDPPAGSSKHLREGEPPESAVDLYEQLKKGKVGKLEGLKFAVLGLGDSSYEFFCQTGKDFDSLLTKAGADRVHELASTDVDYQDAAKAWGEQALNAIAATLSAGPAGSSVASAVQQAVGHSQYSKENPFPARLSVNQKITGRDSTKDIRHIEISSKSPASAISRAMRWASGLTTMPTGR